MSVQPRINRGYVRQEKQDCVLQMLQKSVIYPLKNCTLHKIFEKLYNLSVQSTAF